MRCRERSGFLFAHRCEHPGVMTCRECSKPICALHRRSWQDQDLCISCYRRVATPPAKPLPGVPAPSYYQYLGDPFWYAQHYDPGYVCYEREDFAPFDQEGREAGAESIEDDWDAS